MRIEFSTGLPVGRLSAIATVCLVALLFRPTGPLLGQVRTPPTQNALTGSLVFGAKGCVRCHAINGLGGTEGPDLARFPRPRTFYDLATAMWNHRPGMVERMSELGIEQPHLTARQTGDLIGFLYTLDYFDPAGDVSRGRQLFAEKDCIACHQAGGVGGVVGPDLSSRGQSVAPIQMAAALWNHGPAMSEVMQARGITRPRFTGRELTDLIAYLESESQQLVAAPLYVVPGLIGDGRRVFTEKGCIGCHAVRGRGGELGPDLAQRGVYRSLLAFAAAMWNKAPEMIEAMNKREISIPQLRSEEMADLVGYLYSVKYFAQAGDLERGRRLVRDKGCLDCHSLNGRGGPAAGDIAEINGLHTPAAVIAALWNHAEVHDEAMDRAISWAVFSPGEMADLVTFLQSMARTP